VRPPRLLLAAVLLGAAVLVHPAGAAPGDVGGSIVVAAGGATLGYTTKVAVEPQGTPLTFYDLDQLAHTVTAVDRDADGKPLFNGGALPGSTTVIEGVDKLRAGSYSFFCSFHPNMTGTLVVQGGSGGVGPAAPRFVQPLRIPRQVTGSKIVLDAKQADVQILPGRPATTMLTYGGSWPGPTIRRPVGQKTTVTVVNDLPEAFGETSLHLHGDHHSSADDGQPMSNLIPPGGRKTYTFPLTDSGRAERAMFSFYHDHRMDLTGRNNWYGLQGMVITDDPAEKKLGLPTGAYDVPLLVADRSFDEASQLTNPFPKPGDPQSATSGVNGPYAPPGDATAGSRTLVNGQFQPYAAVGTHRYRLRLLNASPFTSYDFRFSDGRPMVQVGNGAALLPAAVSRTDVLLGPAERADVVVDFGKDLGKSVVLQSVARTDSRPGGIGTPSTPVMQFRVTRRVADTSRVPAALVPVPALAVPTTPTQTFVFGLGADASGLRTRWTINGKPYDHTRVDTTVELGSVQRWRLVNASTITHYIHLHEEAWRTLSRDGAAPPAWEAGYQDVWRLDPGETVEVAARMTDYLGSFLIHCHMLDHEDHGMMSAFSVVKPGTAGLPLPAVSHSHPAAPRSGQPLAVIAASALCRQKESV
jgi:FtsP/CotA-like multicopper oxidase with cupredoxin domain/plastocyanin